MADNDIVFPRPVRRDDDGPAGARGLVACLRKLAHEAADMGLMSANAAIRHAAETCEAELDGGDWAPRGAPLN